MPFYRGAELIARSENALSSKQDIDAHQSPVRCRHASSLFHLKPAPSSSRSSWTWGDYSRLPDSPFKTNSTPSMRTTGMMSPRPSSS